MFWMLFGRYRWLRMPFGISSAPEESQRRQHELLEGLSGIECIVDDILVYGCGETTEQAIEDHNKNLISLLSHAPESNLKLNKDKLRLRLTEVRYIGQVLTAQGLHPDLRKSEQFKKCLSQRTYTQYSNSSDSSTIWLSSCRIFQMFASLSATLQGETLFGRGSQNMTKH